MRIHGWRSRWARKRLYRARYSGVYMRRRTANSTARRHPQRVRLGSGGVGTRRPASAARWFARIVASRAMADCTAIATVAWAASPATSRASAADSPSGGGGGSSGTATTPSA